MTQCAGEKRELAGWLQHPWVWCVGCWLLSRLILQAVGMMARLEWEPFIDANYQWFMHPSKWLDIWACWDTGWYERIARGGYALAVEQAAAEGAVQQQSFAFFPLYPLLLRVLEPVTGHLISAGVLLSNLCFLGACRLLHAFGLRRWGRQEAMAAVAALCFMPHSFIFSAVYTESLFLLLLLGCVLAAEDDRWLLAGLLGALLSATRLVGVTVGLPLLWIYWERRRQAGLEGWRLRRADLRVLWLGLVPLGVAAFAYHLHGQTGDAFAFMKAQHGWGRVWHFPPVAIYKSLFYFGDAENVSLAIATSLSFGLAVCLGLMRRWMELLLAAPLMLVPVVSGPSDVPLASMPRYYLVVFPLVGVMAHIWTQAPTFARWAFLLLALWNGFLMTAWTTGLHIVI